MDGQQYLDTDFDDSALYTTIPITQVYYLLLGLLD